MRLRILGILSLAICVCFASMADAQQRGQRGQRGGGGFGGFGGRGGFGGFGGGGGSGATDLISLLRIEQVREDDQINMDEDTYNVIREATGEAMGKMRELGRDASEADRAKVMKEIDTVSQDLLDEVLDPTAMKRLMGLLVQQRGLSAVSNKLIAKEVGVGDSDLKKVEEAASKVRDSQREKMRAQFQGGGGGGQRPDFAKMMEEARKESDKAIEGVLTAAQKKALDELKGAKFEFPAFEFGRGGRGGPGGNAAGGRGGRGGDAAEGRGGRGGRPGGGGRQSSGDDDN